MATVTVVSTADAWIGPTRATSTADAIIAKLANTKTSTADAYLKKFRFSTADAIIADNRGSFRGEGLLSARNALAPLYAGDTFKVMDDPNAQHMHYFDGSNWSAQSQAQVQESGQARTRRTPNPSGSAAVAGDATYPYLLTRGASRAFSVDGSGNLYANSETFGTSATLNTNDTMNLPETVTYLTPARVQSATAAAASATITPVWASPTTAGNLVLLICRSNRGGFFGQNVATPPAGYTQAWYKQDTIQTMVCYYKSNCSASEANPSLVWVASGALQAVIIEVSGIAAVSALDRTATAVSTSVVALGTTGTTPVTTQAAEYWVGGITTSTITSLVTPGYSSVPSSTGLFVGDAVASATNTVGMNVTYDPSQPYMGGVATFKAATTTMPNPAASTATLYVADYNGTSAYYYRDDAGADHRLTDPGGSTDPGSVTLVTGRYLLQYSRLTITGTELVTLAGTARIVLLNFGDTDRGPEGEVATVLGTPKNPNRSFMVPTDYFLEILQRLALSGSIRATLVGTASLYVDDDFGTRSRIVLRG